MSLEALALAIAGVWILAAILAIAGWARAVRVNRRPSWDLTRRPGYFYELERRRERQRNDRARRRVRGYDAGETASRPARREPSKDDRRRH